MFSHVVGTYDGESLRLYVNGVLGETTPDARSAKIRPDAFYSRGEILRLRVEGAPQASLARGDRIGDFRSGGAPSAGATLIQMLSWSGAAVLALTGCSLVVDTTGLSGGAAADAATASDAATGSDSATASDAAMDAPTSDSDAGVLVENLIPSSDLASTFLNDSQAVTVVTENVNLPTGGSGAALKCTHTMTKPGYFRRGVKLNLTAGETYTLSFFFKNDTIVDIASKGRFELGTITTTYKPSFEEFGATFSNAPAAPDGWIRPTLTFTPTRSQVYEIGFNQTVDQSPIGTYRLFGFQLVKGAVAGPYRSTP